MSKLRLEDIELTNKTLHVNQQMMDHYKVILYLKKKYTDQCIIIPAAKIRETSDMRINYLGESSIRWYASRKQLTFPVGGNKLLYYMMQDIYIDKRTNNALFQYLDRHPELTKYFLEQRNHHITNENYANIKSLDMLDRFNREQYDYDQFVKFIYMMDNCRSGRNNTNMYFGVTLMDLHDTDNDEVGHANILIYSNRNGKRELERYEPNGGNVDTTPDWNFLNDAADQSLQTLVNQYNKHHPADQQLTYHSPHITCPIGLQSIQSYEAQISRMFTRDNDPGGFCAVWSLFLIDYRLSHPDIAHNDIVKHAINNLIQQGKIQTFKIRDIKNALKPQTYQYLREFAYSEGLRTNLDDYDVNIVWLIQRLHESNHKFTTQRKDSKHMLSPKNFDIYQILSNVTNDLTEYIKVHANEANSMTNFIRSYSIFVHNQIEPVMKEMEKQNKTIYSVALVELLEKLG